MSLTEPQIRRYARHILLPEVGGRGQERLLAAKVRIHGEELLANLARSYLEAAGVTCEVIPEQAIPLSRLRERVGEREHSEHRGHPLPLAGEGTPRGLALHIAIAEDPIGDVRLVADSGDPSRVSVLSNLSRGDESPPAAPLETSMVAASLAASEALRLVLGLGPVSHEWQVHGHQITSLPK